jgi:CRP/FNR family transcriptional regulator, cyclic AMP receptor protein
MTALLAAAALAQSSLFSALTPQARQKIVERGAEVRLEPEEILFQKGDEGDGLYIVLEGEIEIGLATEGGRTVRFAALGAGSVLGELAALDGQGRSADARALRRSRLLKVSREALHHYLIHEPTVAVALLGELARRVRAADEAIEAAVLLDLPAKAARLLLAESDHGARLVALTQTEMARRISVTREKLNRRLHAWREEGLVELSKSGVRVCDPHRLSQLVRRRQAD